MSTVSLSILRLLFFSGITSFLELSPGVRIDLTGQYPGSFQPVDMPDTQIEQERELIAAPPPARAPSGAI